MNMNQATHMSAMKFKNSQVIGFFASSLKFMTLIFQLNMLVTVYFVLLQSDSALN